MSADPYKYFRPEAHELVENLTRGVLELEKGHGNPDLVSRLLRHAHTLKGAARIVKQMRISELSHSIEEILAASRDDPSGFSPDKIRQLLAWIDQVSSELTELRSTEQGSRSRENPTTTDPLPAPATPEPAGARTPIQWFEAVRIGIKDMDALLRSLSELRVQLSGLFRQTGELGRAARLADESALPRAAQEPGSRTPLNESPATMNLKSSLKDIHQKISSILDRANRELNDAYEQAATMRLVPANSIFGLLERTARDAAEATGRQVVFEGKGGDTRLDGHGLGLLRNALIHLVRNAVMHGVEPVEHRVAVGKPAAGVVRIKVERHGNRALFVCSDDGRGVDLERVRQVVLQRGLVLPADAARLTPASAMALLLRGGITTASLVSELSGRGIGLDVVRDAVASLRGKIATRTEPGNGTEIEISVPVLVESQEVLHVNCGGRAVSIPHAAIKRALRLTSSDIGQSPEGQTIVFDGQGIGFTMLERLLQTGSHQLPASFSAVVLESQSGIAAFGVDHLLGREEVVIRPIPEILGTIPILGGAFLDSEGNPQLVLNPEGLVKAVHSNLIPTTDITAACPPPLLVIDDSLTTRMLEQGILETAGYEVDTASSGEEALKKARQRRYGLFVVDVEMPGMDGFQFIESARNDPESSGIPSIVVTSRDSEEDRAKGAQLGAKAYIVKSRFDEELLLRTIHELVG